MKDLINNSENEIKVLIVDDDPHILDIVSSLLKEIGYSSITCENAKDAIALVKKERFDTVLTDVKMHKVSGFELLEKIKSVDAEIPVILMTGYADLDSAVNAIKKGAFDFVTKPFTTEHLIQSIKKAVKYRDLITIEKNYKSELKNKIKKKTDEYQSTIKILQKEVAERKKAEKKLKDYGKHIEEIVQERTKDLELSNNALKNEIDKSKFLQEQNIIFRQFTDTSEQGLGMADLEGNVTYANAALCRILGIEKPEDAYRTNIKIYYSEEDLPILENEILPKVMEQGHQTLEMPLRSVDGKIIPAIQSIFLIRDEQDRPFYLANVITDISERMRVENELRNHQDRLEEMVKESTNNLNDRVKELESFYEMAVGRELKMKQLKSKINQLESKLTGYKKIMSAKKENNCWDFWECAIDIRSECPAFKLNSGKACYDLAKNYCPRVGRDFENCWDCPWYKQIHSDII